MTTSAAAAPGPDASVDPSPAKHMSAAQLHACLHVSVAPSRPLLRVNAHWNGARAARSALGAAVSATHARRR